MKKSYAACFKATFLLLIFHSLFLISYSQWYDPEKVNPKAAEIFMNAIEDADNNKYPQAIVKINEALNIEPKFVNSDDPKTEKRFGLASFRISVKIFHLLLVT